MSNEMDYGAAVLEKITNEIKSRTDSAITEWTIEMQAEIERVSQNSRNSESPEIKMFCTGITSGIALAMNKFVVKMYRSEKDEEKK